MNMKNTVILLIFLLAILGLIIGIYYTEEASINKYNNRSYEKVHEDSDGILTIEPEKEKNELSDYFT